MDGGDPSSSWVRLNVGGKVFQTDSDMQPSVKDESGAYLIDRSPEYMDTILNFMRSGYVSISDHTAVPALLSEADFYGLARLIELIESESKKTTVKEIVSVVHGQPDNDKPCVYVTLPTMDTDYDVLKALKTDEHFAKYFASKSDWRRYAFGGFFFPFYGRQTFNAIRSHVTKVVTELGFRVESESENECAFVRCVNK